MAGRIGVSPLTPTLTKQSWGFMIGAAFFAVGSAPWLGEAMGSHSSNMLFFIGAWFFTAAGLIQVFLSGAVSAAVPHRRRRLPRAEWWAATMQSVGTILFNLSTTAALYASSVSAEDRFVWKPDAGGSIAFLVSGVFAFIAYARTGGAPFDARDRGWWSTWINFAGCVAFGASAIGAFVLADGDPRNASLAGLGTFIGALCFFAAALLVLPRRDHGNA